MKINAHGTKLGERFIKKIFDHAISERAEEIYVTVFPHHNSLINLFQRYGFKNSANKGGELVLIRTIRHPYSDVVSSYPLVRLGGNRIFLLSIYPEWHSRLLPDSILRTENSDIVTDTSHTNSIHKVYLAAMKGMETLKRGDILLIYRTKDGERPARFSAVATSICVAEEYKNINSFSNEAEFIEYCKPFSVFRTDELKKFWQKKYPAHVIRFSYNIALNRRPIRGILIDEIGLDENEYWGFMPLTPAQFKAIIQRGEVDESLIVN